MLWGNGGCSADSTGQAPFLTQIASYGVLVIASGTPKNGGSTTSQLMDQAVTFITKNAGTGSFANVDATRIIAAGWSCGGVEAYTQMYNPKVQSIGIWSSGLLTNYTAAKTFNKPVFFFLGGSGDIAYERTASGTTTQCPLAFRSTRPTYPSATGVLTRRPTAASSASWVHTGFSGFFAETRRNLST